MNTAAETEILLVWCLPSTGALYVYDSSVSHADSCTLYAFAVSRQKILEYKKNVIAKLAVVTDDRAVSAVNSYRQWKRNNWQAWLDELASKEQEARDAIIELHKQRLTRLGIEYKGIIPAATHPGRRVTHCYSCKSDLDSSVDVACASCNWILCRCGACGCAYGR